MTPRPIAPFKKIGPLFISAKYKDTKDPCVLFDGSIWHIYGSGGSVESEHWKILHATSPTIEGPWVEVEEVELIGLEGVHMAAPSLVFDAATKIFHMAIQTEFMALGGCIEYFTSEDGTKFTHQETILKSNNRSKEAGIYDPHLSIINNEKYLVYSAMPERADTGRPFIPQPDIYLAKSITNKWSGPWERLNEILNHEEIAWHHNDLLHEDYEWGIEGPQLVELPNNKILLNATCFLKDGRRGTRQRVFFAVADKVRGPYKSVGPVIEEKGVDWESGENGHATAIVENNVLYLFYQARSRERENPADNNWMYGTALFNIDELF